MRALRPLLIASILTSFAVILAASFHSIQEIHYLKSFYPASFTMEEAFYAAVVEMIKLHILSLPLVLVIAVALYVLKAYRRSA